MPSSKSFLSGLFCNYVKGLTKVLSFLPLNMAFSNLLPPNFMEPTLVTTAIVPAVIAISSAYSCAVAKSMPELSFV